MIPHLPAAMIFQTLSTGDWLLPGIRNHHPNVLILCKKILRPEGLHELPSLFSCLPGQWQVWMPTETKSSCCGPREDAEGWGMQPRCLHLTSTWDLRLLAAQMKTLDMYLPCPVCNSDRLFVLFHLWKHHSWRHSNLCWN